MASSSVMSSGLGVCRGYFVGKSSVIRKLTTVSNEKHHRLGRSCYWSVNQRHVLLGANFRHNKLLLPLLSLAPTTTSGIHGERTQLDFGSFPICRASPPGLLLEDEVEDADAFVEVGYIADTHGVQGELHVHSLTDFPEERFGKAGFRWLRTRSMGKPSFQQVELLKGRVGPGKRPSWLITLKNYNTPEKASELVGSTVLVAEDKRPVLDEDEFYVPDLVGMTVALQETGEEIGVVLDLYSTGGGNDLLQVRLVSPTGQTDGRKIWVPFVKEIVPVVDKELRRIEVVPPEGLLELNVPAKDKDEKDKKKEDFKERRKLRGKLGGLKKRLTAMGQTHILAGLSSGTKEQRDALLEQLLSIDFGTLQQVLEEDLSLPNSLVREHDHSPNGVKIELEPRKTNEVVNDRLFGYVQAHTREPEILRKLRLETSQMPGSQMQVTPDQAQFLAMLVQLMGATRCIEVGVFHGYSSLAVALVLPDSGRLVACDRSEKSLAVADEYFKRAGVSHKIEIRPGLAVDTLTELLQGGAGRYDFAFIDADKRMYPQYYELLLELVRPGGLVVVDNVLWHGTVADPLVVDIKTQSIRDFNQFLLIDKRINYTLVAIGDGMALCRKL